MPRELEIGEVATVNGIPVECVDAGDLRNDAICAVCAFRSTWPEEPCRCIGVACMHFSGKGRKDKKNVYFKITN